MGKPQQSIQEVLMFFLLKKKLDPLTKLAVKKLPNSTVFFSIFFKNKSHGQNFLNRKGRMEHVKKRLTLKDKVSKKEISH